MPPVLSYSENATLASELATAAGEVAQALGTDYYAIELDEASSLPADQIVLRAGGRRLHADADLAAAAIAELARSRGLAALLVGETKFGTCVAAKVAARLKMGSLGKGKQLRVDDGRLEVTRDVYGGRFVARVGAKMPCVALVQPGVYPPADRASGRVETIEVKASEPKVITAETRQAPPAEAGIKTASRIVAAGRGFRKKEDLALAQDLASALEAALGSSRPLSSDLGWLSEEQHIGLTGAYVHPKLYVAVGISGQLQHVAGIKDSKIIVAINSDKQAPIFQFADYGIVGDLYEVVPALIKALKS